MLILVRHGRTAHNASRRLLGRLDVPLDEVGERQAAALGASPQLASVERVVASPLQRARRTADALDRPVTVDERWAEIDYGPWDGRPLGEVPADLWDRWAADPEWAPDGAESPAALGRRVRAACEELWPEAARRDVAVVSHVSPIKAAIAWALGSADDLGPRLFVAVASVHRIGPGRRGAPTLHSLNEVHYRPDH